MRIYNCIAGEFWVGVVAFRLLHYNLEMTFPIDLDFEDCDCEG
jgi:hypothetical protein